GAGGDPAGILILRSGLGRVSKDVGPSAASWFETREDALLTMRSKIPLITRPLRIVEHLEGLFELRRDRHTKPFAGRQPRDEPFVVERDQVAAGAELAEGALDHRRQLRLALAEHDAVGIVGQIIAGDLELGLRLVS